MGKIPMKFLSKEDIASVLDLEEVIKITTEVFINYGKGLIYAPPKESLPLQDATQPGMHWINSMPAFLKYKNIVGMKWVNVTSENARRGLPVTMGVILLNDSSTGAPIAVLDGTWITHMRTGASSAIGAKLFARKNSEVITIVGCGAEGETNLLATAKFFKFREIRIIDINKAARESFAKRMEAALKTKVVQFESIEEAVKGSDITLLTTSAQKPLMFYDWAKPGDYISTISCFADLDPAFAHKADKFYMDDAKCALGRVRKMAGINIEDERVTGDIGDVLAGKTIGRESEDEIIIYVPAGMGAVDVGVATEAYLRALSKKLGEDLVLANY